MDLLVGKYCWYDRMCITFSLATTYVAKEQRGVNHFTFNFHFI